MTTPTDEETPSQPIPPQQTTPPAEIERELSDLLVEYLAHLGIEYVFGVPGGAIEPLYNALARSGRKGGPRAITARHETGAVFMADGYARETGKMGVCCATTGPGTTNLITGVASAYADNIPLLVISAQTSLSHFGRGAFQESSPDAIDTVGMFDHCTRYNSIVTHPNQLEMKLASAISLALRQPRGPVHLSVPIDIFRFPAPQQISFPRLEQLLTEPDLFDATTLEILFRDLVDVLERGRNVVVLVGHECSGAIEEVMRFAELVNAKVVTTPRGKSWIDPYHPLVHGVFGFAGHESAYQALTEDTVELVLAIGTHLGEWSTNGWDSNALMNHRLVHIHNSTAAFARSPMARLHLCGKIEAMFKTLSERIKSIKTLSLRLVKSESIDVKRNSTGSSPPISLERRLQEKQRCAPRHVILNAPETYRRDHNAMPPIKPQRLLCELTQRFPPTTRFLADTGNSFAWTTHYLFHTRQGAYRIAMGFAAMGWAIGAAVGTALGKKGVPVVCITGDGSFLMSGQEITVAVAEKLPVVFVILNDSALGMVKHGQRLTKAEPVGFEIPTVDFALMARTMGAEGHSIKQREDFSKIDVKTILSRKGPTLFDVHIDPDEIPPMGTRVKTLTLR